MKVRWIWGNYKWKLEFTCLSNSVFLFSSPKSKRFVTFFMPLVFKLFYFSKRFNDFSNCSNVSNVSTTKYGSLISWKIEMYPILNPLNDDLHLRAVSTQVEWIISTNAWRQPWQRNAAQLWIAFKIKNGIKSI